MTTTGPSEVPLEPLRAKGRPLRVVSLVYGHAHADNRVIKTAASLRAAGADVGIVGAARDREGYPAGPATVGEDVPIVRVPDLDLVRMLPRTAARWRGLRRRLRPGGEATATPRETPRQTPAVATAQPPAPPDPPVPSPEPAPAVLPGRPPTMTAVARARALAVDAYMRTYQTCRLGYYWLGAVREARRAMPDVIHANDGNTLAPALALKALTGAAIVYDAHELWTRRNVRADRWLAPAVEALIERVGIAASAGVITVSPSIVAWMADRYRLSTPPSLVRNIPRAPVGAAAAVDPDGGRLRALAGLEQSDQVIAYVGGITTGRGLEETLAALTLLPAEVHLVLLGSGSPEYRARLLGLAGELGVKDRIHLVGSVPGAQVPQTLADADASVVFVRPICLSYRFSLPNKLFESIHAGLPIVAANLPDTADLVRRYGVGEVFESANAADLAAAVLDVISRSDEFRAASRAAAIELDWVHEERVLIDLYRRVVAAPRRGGVGA